MNDKVENTAVTDSAGSSIPSAEGEGNARKPSKSYVTPQLRRLGSVRELTFGSAGGAPDVPGMMSM